MNRSLTLSGRLFGAALLTLPLVGMGVMRLLSGRDLGAGLQPAWLLLGLATLVAAPAWRASPTVPRAWWFWALAALAALGLSAMGLGLAPPPVAPSEAWMRYLKQFVQLVIMAAFMVWPALWVRGERRWRWAVALVVVGCLGQAAYGLLQFVDWYLPGPVLPALERIFTSNPAILSGSEQLHVGDGFRDVPRLRGTMCEPLYLGNYLLGVIPLVTLLAWRPRWRRPALAAMVVLLFLTWSRGAWLAGGLALALALLLGARCPGRRPAPRMIGLGVAALLLAGVVVAFAPGPAELLRERLVQSFSSRDWSNLTRLYSMQAAWRAFTLSPLVGVGWGQFGWHFPVLVDTAGLQSQFSWPVVNNFPLQILCETGLVGLGVFLTAGITLARAVWRAVGDPRCGELRRRRLIATTVGCAGVWLQLLTFSQYNLPHIWLLPGLLLAALADRTETDADREARP